MRVAKVSVSGLFDLFNHEVPLRLNDRITIIHGPNGFGKTVLLRMLAGLFNEAPSVFRRIPFHEFRVDLDNGDWISIKQEAKRKTATHPATLESTATLHRSSGEASNPVLLTKLRRRFRTQDDLLSQFFERELPVIRIGQDAWRETPTGDLLSLEDVLERYGALLDPALHSLTTNRDTDDHGSWLADLRRTIPVRLIQTKRLDVIGPGARPRDTRHNQLTPAVQQYSEELSKQIKTVLATYAARAQELDRSFPQRLFAQGNRQLPSADELNRKLAALETRRKRLTSIGFLDPEAYLQPASEQAIEAKRDVLAVYVEDVEQKLSVFEVMAKKVDLFARIANSRFLYKKMSINRNQGFVFESDTGTPLSPTDLSSGEQHEIVLLYELLFGLETNSLVLIDEPEISLHPEWQAEFLSDLLKMVQISDFDVLLATHSPEIIGSHGNLATELTGPSQGNPATS